MKNVIQSRKRIGALDGIRFLACTMIIASHCGVLDQGGLGNDIFFCLSGFLCMSPFVKDYEDKFLSFSSAGNYYLNRILRIIPTYWFCLFFVAATLPGFFHAKDFNSYDSLLLNMFFVKSRGHFWFLQQEMAFYVIVPMVFLMLAMVKKVMNRITDDHNKKNITCFVLVTVLALLSNHFLKPSVFHLNGNGGGLAFRLGDFLIGISFGYLYRIYVESGGRLFNKKNGQKIANILMVLFLAFCVCSSCMILGKICPELSGYYIGWEQIVLCDYLAGCFIFLSVAAKDSALSRFVGNPVFAYIGKLSFIMYMIHFFFVGIWVSRGPVYKLILVYFLSLSFAMLTHYLVEKPSILFARERSFKCVLRYYRDLLSA